LQLGRLDALRRYPIKSLRGHALDAVEVETSGIPGDRTAALVAREGARAGKTYRGKEHDRLHLLSDAEEARASAQARGVDVEVRRGERFFDAAPISLLLDAWLQELDAGIGYAVEWERFRPNFFVKSWGDRAPSEMALVGKVLQLGSVRLRVRGPIERCVTVTYHPDGAPADPRILAFLAKHRNAELGIYCDVLEPGTVRRGDPLIRL
jgi:hypothetical protein